jgi:hypothetical protein
MLVIIIILQEKHYFDCIYCKLNLVTWEFRIIYYWMPLSHLQPREAMDSMVFITISHGIVTIKPIKVCGKIWTYLPFLMIGMRSIRNDG